ncbi:MAG: hypothetical protein MPW15_12360 [Candidatus Manganitrophus sp.]|nr:hypothetical protein [Candidatus Manganitrophus sp.]WDT74289.1 MAG: hypothetical protein MPW16_13615 [Candidatus Manganitrophus sp.]
MGESQKNKKMIQDTTETIKHSVDGIAEMRPVKPEPPKESQSDPKGSGNNNQGKK